MKNKTIASLSLRKLLLSVLVTAPLATLPVPLWALPTSQANLDSQISSTSGATATWNSASSVTVTSTTTNSIVRWKDFGAAGMTIGSGDTITYNMPSSSSAVLNTVTGVNPTTIDGTLTTGANGGSIWVQNPNGITVGSTGVINATNIGLSTVPESEFYFTANGRLQFSENTSNTSGTIVTSSAVALNNGATLTAASGTGNVWIAGKGITAAGGVIDAGNVTLTGFQGGAITLASGGDLTIGDVSNKNSTLTVTQTTAGAITVDAAHNLTVMGPSVSLNSGNGTISTANSASAGVFTIGAGSPSNATLTTASGTGDTTLTAIQAAGTGTLNVTSTGANITLKSPGKLAVTATGTSLTAQAAGNLTVNAGNVSGNFDVNSTGGDIISGGTMVVGGTATVNASAGHNIALHFAGAPALTFTTPTGLGNVSITEDSGSLTTPAGGLSASNIWLSSGNITTGGTLTATSSGLLSLTATAGNVTLGSQLVAGNISVTASNSVLATAGASANASGTISLTGTAGNVDTTNLTVGNTTAPLALTLWAGKGVNIATAVGNVITATAGTTLTQTGAVESVGTGGSVTYTAGGDLAINNTIGATTAPKSISLTSSGNITVGGGLTTQTNGTVTATAAGLLSNNSVITAPSGTVSLTANGGNVTSGTITAGNIALTASKAVLINGGQNVNGTYSASANGGDVVQDAVILGTPNPSSVTLSSTSGNVSIGHTAGATISAGNVTVTAGAKINVAQAVTTTTGASLTATGNVNITAAVIAPTLSIKGAYINESGAGVITSTGTTTLDSSSAIALGAATNDFNIVVVKNAPSDASITDANAVILGGGTSVSGNLTIAAAGTGIQLGNASSDAISVSKSVFLTTTAGDITDLSDNLNLTTAAGSSVNLSSAGAITLDGSAGTGIGLNNSFGQINITATAADVKLFENTTLNLGTLALGAHNLTAYSATSIINSGVITQNAGQTIKVGAGSATNPGTISLDYNDSTAGSNKILGKVSILTNNDIHGVTGGGSFLASSIKIVNDAAAATLFELIPNVDTPNPSVNVDLQTINATPLNVGQLSTSGTVNLTSATGAITATNANNTFTAVNVKSGGAVTVSSSKDLTVNGNITGGTGAVAYTSAGNLTIGSYTSLTTGGTSFTGTAGSVSDSLTNISIYGPVAFSGKTVSITKSGHSFGPVSVTTSGNGAATITEATTLNLATVNTGTGAFNALSNGGILQTGSLTAGNVTAWAPQGTVTLTNASNNVTGWVSLTASGNSSVKNTAALSLGNVTVSSGTFTADTSANNTNISQATGTSIYTYGATTVNAGTGTITLANAGNQFGALSLGSAGAGAISVKEQTTMNLKLVKTAGNFTATSTGGSIVDSQAADGDISVGGTATLTAASNVNISAKNAAITTVVGNAGGDFTLATGGGLTATVSAGGNATLNPTGALVFGNSTIKGDLSVHGGTTTITQTGGLHVTGNVTLWGTAFTLNDATNEFGAVQLHNSDATLTTSITEAGTFNLRAGTVAQGQVIIPTGGDFITSGVGGSSFTGGTGADAAHAGLVIHAPNGSITFGAGSVVVTNRLTVDATGTKDLSQLTYVGNLNGKHPFYLGTGTNIKPADEP